MIDHYVNDYTGFIRGEVERVVEDFTTDATNTVNVAAVLRRRTPQPEGMLVQLSVEIVDMDRPSYVKERL